MRCSADRAHRRSGFDESTPLRTQVAQRPFAQAAMRRRRQRSQKHPRLRFVTSPAVALLALPQDAFAPLGFQNTPGNSPDHALRSLGCQVDNMWRFRRRWPANHSVVSRSVADIYPVQQDSSVPALAFIDSSGRIVRRLAGCLEPRSPTLRICSQTSSKSTKPRLAAPGSQSHSGTPPPS